MSSDFYLKTQTLYEEFKNKELRYLNGEQKLNEILMWKKDLNVPLQEYLQQIHQREKKNEETYRSIMKQMNDLDQHTDLLFSKIDKLRIFRNIQAGYNLNDTNYSLTSRYVSPSLNAIQNFNTEPLASHFESSSLKSSTLKSVSTQTESNVYCENCRYLILVSSQPSQLQNSSSSTIDILSVSKDEHQILNSTKMHSNSSFLNKNDNSYFNTSENIEHIPPQMYDNRSPIQVPSTSSLLKNSSSSTVDILSVSKDEPQIIDPSRMQNDSFAFLNKDGNNSQFNTSEKSEPLQIYENKEHIENNSKSMLQIKDKDGAKSPTVNTALEKSQFLKSNGSLTAVNAQKNCMGEKMLTVSQSKSNESEINVEVSKGDADSVNQEFDFLESDTVQLSSKVKTQINSKNNTAQSGDTNQNTDPAGLNVKIPKSSVKLKNERDTFQSNKEQEMSDNRSETSENVSGTRSPVISLSDSDSMNERGSFSTSAAYQSLLGNTIIPSKVNKQVSESDSEDEVEKTLANTVKKPNMKAKPNSQPKKDKSTSQSVDSNPVVNRPKPSSTNKPQMKLSKSTKKVLGIDTSSSSEMEVAAKPFENKKDEDSDEFDFYD